METPETVTAVTLYGDEASRRLHSLNAVLAVVHRNAELATAPAEEAIAAGHLANFECEYLETLYGWDGDKRSLPVAVICTCWRASVKPDHYTLEAHCPVHKDESSD